MAEYNQELENNLDIRQMECMYCHETGVVKNIKLVGVEPEEIISVFTCDSCGGKDVLRADYFLDESVEAKIECVFDDKSDLLREIYLAADAKVKVISEDFQYEYESYYSGVLNVEAILLQAKDELDRLLSNSEALQGGAGCFLEEGVTVARIEAKKAALQNLLTHPSFNMTIIDPKGTSRVAPVGKGIHELQYESPDQFDDEKVKHIILKKDTTEIGK